MRKKLLLFLSLFVAASVSAQMSGTYTINGDASQNPDYQTISDAATAVASQGVNGNVVFEVAPGTYDGYVTVNSISGTSDDARVTFKGMGAIGDVVLTSNAGYTDNSTLTLNGADFVTFENMTIQTTSENRANVVRLKNGLEGDMFKDVRFIGAVWESNQTDNDKNVVYRVSGSWIDTNNSFINCEFINGCVGLYYQGYNTTQYNDGLLVENCTFSNQNMKGVYATFVDHVTVRGCTINNMSNDLKADYNAIDISQCRYNCVFENNVINVKRENTYSSVFKMRPCTGTEEEPIIVRNNIINLETNVSNVGYALYIDNNNTSWVYVLHNTFNIKGTGVASNIFILKTIANVFVHNNLFVNETSGYIFRFANAVADRACDYNRVSFAGENVGLQAGTDYATLADWTTATGFDANTTTCTPNFVSETNMHLADTTGSVIVPNYSDMAPTDIDGETRSTTAPCAGADEFVSTTPVPDLYTVTITETENGEVEASAYEAEEGTVITLTVTPDSGYELLSLTYVYGDNDPIDITTAKSFSMPAANVTVNATFKHAPVETLIAHFEDVEIDADGFWKPTEDEQDDMGYAYMQSQGWSFQNYYYDYYGYTGTMGFTASNCTDTTLTGIDAQYTAVTGKGYKSSNYAMCYPMGNTTVAAVDGYPRTVTGCYVTNDLWTYQAILEGDGYGPQFGGEDGTTPDYMKIVATGLDEEGEEISSTEFYLADYRFADNTEDYVVADWRWFDLSVLGEVSAIRFDLESSRNNEYGMTTPGYFCMDDFNGEAPAEPVETLIAHFEDVEIDADGFWKPTEDEQDDMGYAYMQSQGWSFQNYYYDYYGYTGTMGFTASNCTDTTLTGLDAQYTSVTGKGYKSSNYAMCYPMGNTTVAAVDGYPRTVTGCYVTNDLWTYQAILEGDGYGPQFGGEDGTTPDFMKIIATGLDEEGEEISSTEFYLADYRFADNAEDYVVADWRWFDLSVLGEVSAIRFDLESSRNNEYGMTTPGYFCMDDFNGEAPAEPVETLIAHFEDVELNEEGIWASEEYNVQSAVESQGWSFSALTSYSEWEGTGYESWSQFRVSNSTNTELTGLEGQYTAVPGKGLKSANYAVAYVYGNTEVSAIDGYPRTVTGCYVTNNMYAYTSMTEGDSYAGDPFTTGDYLVLYAIGLDEMGDSISGAEFYLADYRSDNEEEQYIVEDWRWFDLSVLGEVSKVRFDMAGSRTGEWGLNTPAYFCMDDFNGEAPAEPVETLIAHFEDVELNEEGIWASEEYNVQSAVESQGWSFSALTSYSEWEGTGYESWSQFRVSNSTNTELAGLDGQYTAVPGHGYDYSDNYAVAYVYGNTEVSAIDGYPREITGCYVTNNMYAYASMTEGDYYAGDPFTTGDYLVLYAIGLDEMGDSISSAEFYLADYRSDNEEEHYIVEDWRWFDLSVLGEVSKVRFDMAGSRTGEWGLNTPAYFCLDNYNGIAPDAVKEVIAENDNISVYPNPSNGVVNVKVAGIEEYTYYVYNSVGQIVMTGTIAKSITTIDFSAFGSGMYFINVNHNGNVTTKKVFIK